MNTGNVLHERKRRFRGALAFFVITVLILYAETRFEGPIWFRAALIIGILIFSAYAKGLRDCPTCGKRLPSFAVKICPACGTDFETQTTHVPTARDGISEFERSQYASDVDRRLIWLDRSPALVRGLTFLAVAYGSGWMYFNLNDTLAARTGAAAIAGLVVGGIAWIALKYYFLVFRHLYETFALGKCPQCKKWIGTVLVLERGPGARSRVRPGAHCPHCGQELKSDLPLSTGREELRSSDHSSAFDP